MRWFEVSSTRSVQGQVGAVGRHDREPLPEEWGRAITFSHEIRWAKHPRLIEAHGLAGQARIDRMDYRDLDEREPYDKIASVGMFEHVGHARMPGYFAKIRRLLRPGGLVMNHGITAGLTRPGQLDPGLGDFIDRYIDRRTDVKPSTRRNLEQSARSTG